MRLNKSKRTIKKTKKKSQKKIYKNSNNVKLYVISVDNDKGRERRTYLNYKYKWIKAIYMDDSNNPILNKVRSKVTIRYNMSKDSKKYKAATANISSHIKILKMAKRKFQKFQIMTIGRLLEMI